MDRTVTVDSLARTGERALYDYVIRWIRNPDPGSAFEKATKKLRLDMLPDQLLFWMLLLLRYNGILFLDKDGAVVGHIFFQRHKFKRGTKELHAFSFFLRDELRGRGYTTQMMRALYAHCRTRELRLVRMTAGGSDIMQRIWLNIADRKIVVPFEALPHKGIGWLAVV